MGNEGNDIGDLDSSHSLSFDLKFDILDNHLSQIMAVYDSKFAQLSNKLQ